MEYRLLNFSEAKNLMDVLKEYVFIDVREEDEYSLLHAKGAILFPLGSINYKSAKELISSLDTPIFVYCRSGIRSKKACKLFLELGYNKVYDLGGLAGWPYGYETGL